MWRGCEPGHIAGTLEAEELLELSEWVFSSFHPGDEPVSEEARDKIAEKLLERLDKNGDGVMDFDEFSGWYARTCGKMALARKKGKPEEGLLSYYATRAVGKGPDDKPEGVEGLLHNVLESV